MNRIGDWGLMLALFGIFWVTGSLEFSTLFTIAPLIDPGVISLIGIGLLVGAMAKSAQIGLHTWLPQAMEGEKGQVLLCILFWVTLVFRYYRSILCAILPFSRGSKKPGAP